MSELGLNLKLFKNKFKNDGYWLNNLGSRDYWIIEYLFNRIYEEQYLLDKYEIAQEIVDYTRSKQKLVEKYNSYVYQELRNQFEAFQNEIKNLDSQISFKLDTKKQNITKMFNC